MGLVVPIIRLPHSEGLPLPDYASPGAAGLDLYAAVKDRLTINPGTTIAVPTSISIALPPGFEGQVRPRSGMALKHQIGIINSPGTIDSDYRGEIKVLLTNFSDQNYEIKRGDRIAQLVIAHYERVEWSIAADLPSSERDSGGFGHSGR
ncbi:MAG: dUTP diphosphatase [Candidatus Hatepunaea meridiana]|nr:dUTP diphosphatase [Candidatus Hatepunaea meridiana]